MEEIKYAIQCAVYYGDEEKEWTEWRYVAVKTKLKIFVFEESVTNDTKLFDTAKIAGEYLDKHFGKEKQRASYETVRIVEVTI